MFHSADSAVLKLSGPLEHPPVARTVRCSVSEGSWSEGCGESPENIPGLIHFCFNKGETCKVVPPQLCLFGYNPHEYYRYNLPMNPNVIGLANQLNAFELGHHLVEIEADFSPASPWWNIMEILIHGRCMPSEYVIDRTPWAMMPMVNPPKGW